MLMFDQQEILMGEAFRLGGWGMYPTLIAGLVLVACAMRYALAPDTTRALIVRRLSLLTFLAGCMGFTSGLIRTLVNAPELPPDEFNKIIATGIGESLNNIGLALGLLIMSSIAMSIGAARTGRSDKAELHAP